MSQYVQRLWQYNSFFIDPTPETTQAVFELLYSWDDIYGFKKVHDTQMTLLDSGQYTLINTSASYDQQLKSFFYTIYTDGEGNQFITPYEGNLIYNYLFQKDKKVFPVFMAPNTDITAVYCQLIRTSLNGIEDNYYYDWTDGTFKATLSELQMDRLDNPIIVDLNLMADPTNIFYSTTSFIFPNEQATYKFVYRYVYESIEYTTEGESYVFTADAEYVPPAGSGGESDLGFVAESSTFYLSKSTGITSYSFQTSTSNIVHIGVLPSTKNGTALYVDTNIDTAGLTMRACIYEDVGGFPSIYLGASDSLVTEEGYNKFTLNPSINIESGKSYWIALKGEGNISYKIKANAGDSTILEYNVGSSFGARFITPAPPDAMTTTTINKNLVASIICSKSIMLSATDYLTSIKNAVKNTIESDSWLNTNITTIETSFRAIAYDTEDTLYGFDVSEVPAIAITTGKASSERIAGSEVSVTVPVVISFVYTATNNTTAQETFDNITTRLEYLMQSQDDSLHDFNGLGAMCTGISTETSTVQIGDSEYNFYASIIVNVQYETTV